MKKYIYVKEISTDLFPSRTKNIFAAENTQLTPATAKCLEFAELHFAASQDGKAQRRDTNTPSYVVIQEMGNMGSSASPGEDPLSSILGRGNRAVLFFLSLSGGGLSFPVSLSVSMSGPCIPMLQEIPVSFIQALCWCCGALSLYRLPCSNGCASSSTVWLEMSLGNNIATSVRCVINISKFR